MMNEDLRIKFSNAYKTGDEKTVMSILGMALAGVTSSEGLNVHISGESETKN